MGECACDYVFEVGKVRKGGERERKKGKKNESDHGIAVKKTM